jgi:hypothetical protein
LWIIREAIVKLIYAFGIIGAAIVLGTPAKAQNQPWCAQYSGGGIGGGTNCGFATYAQCLAAVGAQRAFRRQC